VISPKAPKMSSATQPLQSSGVLYRKVTASTVPKTTNASNKLHKRQKQVDSAVFH